MLGEDPTDRTNFSTREEKTRVGAEVGYGLCHRLAGG
jgi:hypothetical protein